MSPEPVKPPIADTLREKFVRDLGFEPSQVDDNTKLHGLTLGTLVHCAAAAWHQGADSREADFNRERGLWDKQVAHHRIENENATALLRRALEAIKRTDALMIRPAHIASCHAYGYKVPDKNSPTGARMTLDGPCTCGVEACHKANTEALAAISRHLEGRGKP